MRPKSLFNSNNSLLIISFILCKWRTSVVLINFTIDILYIYIFILF